jgi:predicted CXXCH cytochrome family protein
MSRYFCSLFFVMVVFLSTSAMAGSKFVGSAKCMSCHKQIYETWEESTHNRAVQEVTPSHNAVIAQWKGVVKLNSGKLPEATVKLDRGADGEFLATLVDSKDPAKETTYKVVRTQGAGSMKGQMYYTKIGNNYFGLPLNWETISSKFVPTSMDNWYNEDGSLKQPSNDKSWEMTCALCHQTGLEYKKVENGYEATYSDLSIGCEKCHGPGSEHINSPNAKGKIINPRNLEYERGMDVCNQCHDTPGKSVPKGIIRGAWDEVKNIGYKIGEPLTNYMQSGGMPLSPGLRPIGASDTYHMLGSSKHHDARTNCFDCHNPHGGPTTANLKRGDMDNSLCLHCHAKEKEFATPEAIMKHTKHSYDPDMKGTSRCTYCHTVQSRRQKAPSVNGMPAGGMRGMMMGFLSVSKPQQSLEMFKSDPKGTYSNACNKCHKEWSGDEAGYVKGVEAYKAKFGE